MPAGLGRRAHSVEEFRLNMQAFFACEAPNYRPVEPRAGDVYITCFAKSGTTLMQQMFHQLRTGGDMEFDDISRVVPWAGFAEPLDFDMNQPQKAAPRGFKAHDDYASLPPGMRYVVTLRDPRDAYASYCRFIDGWMIEPGTVPVEGFMDLWAGGDKCDYFDHLLSWYARKDEPDTLLATYRSVIADRPAMIRRLADFVGIALTPELAALVEHRTSRAFMYAHKDRFDDRMLATALSERLGIPADSDSSKVQAVGSSGKQVPPVVAEQIDAMWAERVAPVTGHADFGSLAAELESQAH